MIARPSMGDIRDVSFSRISIARAGLAAGLSRSMDPAQAVCITNKQRRRRRRVAITKCAVFPTSALMRGRRSSRSM
jgi:hypothetical protein